MAMRARDKWLTLGLGCALGASASLATAQWGMPLGAAPIGAAATSAIDAQLVDSRTVLDRGRVRKSEIELAISNIAPRKAELKQRLLRDGRSLYRVSRGGLLPLAGGLDALLGHASRVARLTRIVEGEATELASLDHDAVALRKELAELELRMSKAERDVSTLEQARVGLAQQHATQALFDAAFAESRPRADDGRVQYGLSIVGGGIATERFADQRGNLAMPVSGPSSISEARRAESDGPGLELKATTGAAVRAAAGGRVAFADRYGSYGQIVIIDHGERFYTVYGGLGSIEVQVGDDLSKSARLGVASVDPIYFEVRRGTKTQDARTWLGL